MVHELFLINLLTMISKLENRNLTISNKLNARISEQSRDIALEAKRDSRAMKAIAVLTMFFLPGAFIAVSGPIAVTYVPR